MFGHLPAAREATFLFPYMFFSSVRVLPCFSFIAQGFDICLVCEICFLLFHQCIFSFWSCYLWKYLLPLLVSKLYLLCFAEKFLSRFYLHSPVFDDWWIHGMSLYFSEHCLFEVNCYAWLWLIGVVCTKRAYNLHLFACVTWEIKLNICIEIVRKGYHQEMLGFL